MKRFLLGVGCGAFFFSMTAGANQPQYVYPPASGALPTSPVMPAPVSAVPLLPNAMNAMGSPLPAMPYRPGLPGMAPQGVMPMGSRMPQPMVMQAPGMMPPTYSYPPVNGLPNGMPPVQIAQPGQVAYPPVNSMAPPANVNPYQGLPGGTPGPYRPPPPPPKQPTKPWGDTRYIWPDFYTDFTGDFWDKMINAPYEMGYMPGGWRFPSFSSPDPVTVGDAVANQVPPIMEEVPNFINFAN